MKLFYPTVYTISARTALKASALFALCLSMLQPCFAQPAADHSGADVAKNTVSKDLHESPAEATTAPYNHAMLDVHPVPGQLFITVGHPAGGEKAQLQLVDANGKTVQQVAIDKNSAQTKLGIEKLAPGTYKIRWSNGSKTMEQPLLMF